MITRFVGLLGLIVIIGLAWLISSEKKKVNLRIVLGGIFLQFLLGFVMLKTTGGQAFFEFAKNLVTTIINLSDKGAQFVFGNDFQSHFFAFKVLPTIIFVSSLSYVLFYWGIIQKIVSSLASVMNRVMDISGVESLVTAANIFCGQTEAPLFIKPYLKDMTRSEINTMMTSGMATTAGGVLAAYVGLGVSAGHLLAASLMSAPASVVLAKIILPEVEKSKTKNITHPSIEIKDTSVFEAACSGAGDGLKMALNVGAMLIAFIALIALINLMLSVVGNFFGWQLSLEGILGIIFQPLAFLIGIPWQDSQLIGQLLGEKMVLNEFIAYIHLGEYIKSGLVQERSVVIATYALCGFANFSSIAVQIGGIGALAPEKKSDFVICGFKAMIGGTLATMMTASIAGLLL